jgi:hypothetical protein
MAHSPRDRAYLQAISGKRSIGHNMGNFGDFIVSHFPTYLYRITNPNTDIPIDMLVLSAAEDVETTIEK